MRKCECGTRATEAARYYMVGTRRVRVWICVVCFVKQGKRIVEVPAPPSVQAALDAEARHQERVRKTPFEFQERSVRTLANSGHGERVPYDAIANWRWMGW